MITKLPQCFPGNEIEGAPSRSTSAPSRWSPAIVDYELFDSLTDQLDSLLELYEKVSKVTWLMKNGLQLKPEQLELLEDFKRQDVKAACGRIQCLEQLLDPDEAYNEDGTLRKELIMECLARLLMSFPIYKPNPTHSTRLLQETMRKQPKLYVLEGACRHWVRTEDWPPVPAQMLRTLDAQQELWTRRWRAADHIVEDQQALLNG
jgi:hypothetical protein